MATSIYLGMPPPKIKEWIEKNYKPEVDMTKVPLHFVAEEPNATISFSIGYGTYETSPTGEEGSWTPYKSKTIITLSNVGDKVYFRAGSDEGNETCDGSQFYIGKNGYMGKIAAKGNIQSLLDRKMERMYVTDTCYSGMFQDCTSLTQAPELPATTLNYKCYSLMFSGCTSLSKPEFKMSNLTFDEVVDAIQNDYIIGGDADYYDSKPTFTYEIQCSDKTMIATPIYEYDEYGYYVTGWTLEEKK